ncbi:MAG: hypothetical protein AB7F86_02955 [Bdellovibrionales bacterium]
MLQRNLWIVLAAIIGFQIAPAFAQKTKIDQWILTYDELMRTSPKQREIYLNNLRAAIIEFETQSQSGLLAFQDRSIWEEVAQGFFLPDAAADDGPCGPYLTLEGNVCVRIIRAPRHNGLDKRPPSTYSNCRNIPGKDEWKCVSDEAPDLTKVATTPPKVAEKAPAPPPPASNDRCLEFHILEGDACVRNIRSPRNGPLGKTPPAGYTKCENIPGKDEWKCTSEDGPTPIKTASVDPKDGAPKAAGDAVCGVKKPACESDREKYRAEFQSQRRNCVYAGNFSDYSGGTPRKGKCKPVTRFKISETDKGVRCPSGKVLCNPLVFGYKPGSTAKKPKGICVSAKSDATTACDEAAPQGNSAKLFEEGPTGFKEKWNEYAKDLKKICGEDKASLNFHCGECGVLYQRLFNIAKGVKKNICDQAAAQPAESTTTK